MHYMPFPNLLEDLEMATLVPCLLAQRRAIEDLNSYNRGSCVRVSSCLRLMRPLCCQPSVYNLDIK